MQDSCVISFYDNGPNQRDIGVVGNYKLPFIITHHAK